MTHEDALEIIAVMRLFSVLSCTLLSTIALLLFLRLLK